MLRPSIQSPAQPSLFYLIMAESCFHRAARTRRPNVRGTLRDIGRNYLAKANAPHAEPRAVLGGRMG